MKEGSIEDLKVAGSRARFEEVWNQQVERKDEGHKAMKTNM